MILLALDTATPAVTAGVVRRDEGEHLIAERVTVDARAHAETLTPNVLAAMADSGLRMTDLDAVVIGCGPGPFTGLRVGMATAAAFGHALDIPVYGVCSLDAIGMGTSGDVLVVTDARRREVYWARYRDGIRTAGPAVDAPADEPDKLLRTLDHIGSDSVLLFSTDYPHWHFDGDDVLPDGLGDATIRKILNDNPLDAYPRLRDGAKIGGKTRATTEKVP